MNEKNRLDDPIAAISTPMGMGGIGIVRMSGAGCIALADQVFRGKKPLKDKKSHTLSYGTIVDREDTMVDEVLVSVMKEPNTYTKEDIVEINCHGGSLITHKVLEVLLNTGARLAEPGEFTKRAFLNGRMDLTQAEAVIDLIHAQTDLGSQAALNQLAGRLKTQVKTMRDEILDMIASIEAVIDYPEHDEEEETYETMRIRCEKLLHEMEDLLSHADRGKIIREGLETVIIGKPNVGKSSLLNWLLEEERAIVTDIPGTTRDTVEEYINIDGIPIKIVDTAGIRETTDQVEQMGVEKAKAYAQSAHVILMIVDGSKELDQQDKEILEFIESKKAFVLINKSDLEQKINIEDLAIYIPKEQMISISVKENQGFKLLVEGLKYLFFQGEKVGAEHAILGNTRHKDALFHSKEAMERALITIKTRMPEDFISMDLQDANRGLGEITGDVADEEIIHRIFTKFCLGK